MWPLLAIALVAGLDAWRVLSMPPLRESDLSGADDRDAALRRLSNAAASATTPART